MGMTMGNHGPRISDGQEEVPWDGVVITEPGPPRAPHDLASLSLEEDRCLVRRQRRKLLLALLDSKRDVLDRRHSVNTTPTRRSRHIRMRRARVGLFVAFIDYSSHGHVGPRASNPLGTHLRRERKPLNLRKSAHEALDLCPTEIANPASRSRNGSVLVVWTPSRGWLGFAIMRVSCSAGTPSCLSFW